MYLHEKDSGSRLRAYQKSCRISGSFGVGIGMENVRTDVFSGNYSRMPMISHLWPRNRGTKKAMRTTQSASMAIQTPMTPKPQ